jgi:hypothetical protein
VPQLSQSLNMTSSRVSSFKLHYAELIFQTGDPAFQTGDPISQTRDSALQTENPILQTRNPTFQTEDPILQTGDPLLQTRICKTEMANSVKLTNPVPLYSTIELVNFYGALL